MPSVNVNGVQIAYHDAGEGFPIIWAHEFAGSMESWEPQVRFFSRRYRVITYNARGYPPSDVPEGWESYDYREQVEDMHALLAHLGIERAVIGGLSMGAYTALCFGLAYPEATRALVVAGVGTGSGTPEGFKADAEGRADQALAGGMATLDAYARGSTRARFAHKDPEGYREFVELFMAHSPLGTAYTLKGFQARRPSIYTFEKQLTACEVPTLLLVGDEDDPCLEPALFLKRTVSTSALVVLPQSGHAVNIEEPALFNQAVAEFLAQVESGRWTVRDMGSGESWPSGR